MDAIAPGKLAVITGAASGIGLATAKRLAAEGMQVCLVDRAPSVIAEAEAIGGAGFVVDVADRAAVETLAADVAERFGTPAFLMNNAASREGGDALSNPDDWVSAIGVNLMGVLHGVQAFVPAMLASGAPGIVVNTGSKQGITQPPGNTAYNVAKSGVKALTEGLAHTLREQSDLVTAHLLIPGFTYTGMSRQSEKPAEAWTADQVVDFMLDALATGDFYILCPDNDVTRAMDEKRMAWAIGDIMENRPALSRWHRDWKDSFAKFMG